MRELLGLVVAMGLVMGTLGCSEAPPSFGGGGKGGLSGDGDGDSGDGDSDDEGDGDRGDGDSGDGDGDGDDDPLVEGECGTIEKTAELERGAVDIVWAIDSSGSMADEFLNVVNNIGVFAEKIANSGVDAHVVMMHLFGLLLDPLDGTALGMDTSRYKYLVVNVDSHNALEVLLDEYNNYKGMLRPDAATHLVVVSDDESDLASSTFLPQMEQKLGHDFFFHAVVADGNGCNGASVGTQYLNLADATMGQKMSICASDWTKLFDQLQAAVVASAPLPCDFEIPTPPENQELDIENGVRVLYAPPGGSKGEFGKATDAAQCGDKDGWYESGGRIEFCPAACEKVKGGGTVAIGFGCAAAPLL